MTERTIEDKAFDFEYQKETEKYKGLKQDSLNHDTEIASHEAEAAKRERAGYDDFNKKTDIVQMVAQQLEYLDQTNPDLAFKTREYLDKMVEKGGDTLRIDKELARIQGRDHGVDLDGSKRTFWSRMKNKVKDVLHPNNAKKDTEMLLGKLQAEMIKDPAFFSHLSSTAKDNSFDGMAAEVKSMKTHYHEQEMKHRYEQEAFDKSAQQHQTVINDITKEQQQIGQIREETGQQMALKAEARETNGSKAADSNSGIYVLGEKERLRKENPNMPIKELYGKLRELQGIKKVTPSKPVKKTTLTPEMTRNAAQTR